CVGVGQQPGLLEAPKMLGDRRWRDPGPSRQCPDRLLSVAAQSLEDRPPSRIGERSEQYIVSLRHFAIDNQPAIDRRITTEIYMSQAGTWIRKTAGAKT